MKIEYLGHSCFLITTERGTRLVTDPYTGVGYEMPPVCADYVTCSHFHFDHGYTDAVRGVKKVLSSSGKFVCDDIAVEGVDSFHDDVRGLKRGKNVIFVFQIEGKRICHMGDVGEVPSQELAARLGKPDVLLLPVGGTYTIDAAGAMETIRRVSPKEAVAMHFRCKDCTLDIDTEDKLIALAGSLSERVGSEIPLERQGKILIPARKF